MTEELLKITKLEVACRQIDVAIELWFNEGDPISTHTLAAAARRVAVDVLASRGEVDRFMQQVKPEHQRLVREKIAEPGNFFKHADRDPNADLEFDPQQNDYVIWYCVDTLRQLGQPVTSLQHAFYARFGLERPHLLKAQPITSDEDRQTLRDLTRPQFLRFHKQMPELSKVSGSVVFRV